MVDYSPHTRIPSYLQELGKGRHAKAETLLERAVALSADVNDTITKVKFIPGSLNGSDCILIYYCIPVAFQ